MTCSPRPRGCDPIGPQTGLLVLNSLAFPFQHNFQKKDSNAIFDRLMQTVARARGLTVRKSSYFLRAHQIVSERAQNKGPPGSRS